MLPLSVLRGAPCGRPLIATVPHAITPTTPSANTRPRHLHLSAFRSSHVPTRRPSVFLHLQKRWHAGHSPEQDDERTTILASPRSFNSFFDANSDQGIVNLGLNSDIFLAVLKISCGVYFHSPLLVMDGIHSASDVFVGLVPVFATRLKGRPKSWTWVDRYFSRDKDALRKIDPLGSMIISNILICTGGYMFVDASKDALTMGYAKLTEYLSVHAHAGHFTESVSAVGVSDGASPVTIGVAVLVIAIKEALRYRTAQIAERHNSDLLRVTAAHHRQDSYSTAAALTGLVLSYAGVPMGEPLAMVFVSYYILRMGVVFFRRSALRLADCSSPLPLHPSDLIDTPIQSKNHDHEHDDDCHSDETTTHDPKFLELNDDMFARGFTITERRRILDGTCTEMVDVEKEGDVSDQDLTAIRRWMKESGRRKVLVRIRKDDEYNIEIRID